jgi:hypothetical protein
VILSKLFPSLYAELILNKVSILSRGLLSKTRKSVNLSFSIESILAFIAFFIPVVPWAWVAVFFPALWASSIAEAIFSIVN